MDRIAQNLKNGKLSVGTETKGYPAGMDALAKAGFDFVYLDMMWSTMTWESLHHNIMSARQAGLSPMVRLDAYPWGIGEHDRRICVDAGHAFSLGAGGVSVSVSGVKEVEQMSKVLEDWHQMGQFPIDKEFKVRGGGEHPSRGLFPLIECTEAFDDLEKILDVDGVVAPFIACTDLAKQVGHAFDPEHPDVWKLVESSVKMAEKRNKFIMANTSYPSITMEANSQRIKRLHDHGVKIVLLQTDFFLLYCAGKQILDGVNKLIR